MRPIVHISLFVNSNPAHNIAGKKEGRPSRNGPKSEARRTPRSFRGRLVPSRSGGQEGARQSGTQDRVSWRTSPVHYISWRLPHMPLHPARKDKKAIVAQKSHNL